MILAKICKKIYIVNLTKKFYFAKMSILKGWCDMKIDNKIFETLLRNKAISKKDFSEYAGISYNTVAGWKKSGFVPAYAVKILKQMPFNKAYVTANEVISAGMPRAILWNTQLDKSVPYDVFIVSTLKKAYNDFVIDKLIDFFGKEEVLASLLKYKNHLSDRLVSNVLMHITKDLYKS